MRKLENVNSGIQVGFDEEESKVKRKKRQEAMVVGQYEDLYSEIICVNSQAKCGRHGIQQKDSTCNGMLRPPPHTHILFTRLIWPKPKKVFKNGIGQ